MKVLAVISLLLLLVASVQGAYTTERQYQREFSRFVKNFSKRQSPLHTSTTLHHSDPSYRRTQPPLSVLTVVRCWWLLVVVDVGRLHD